MKLILVKGLRNHQQATVYNNYIYTSQQALNLKRLLFSLISVYENSAFDIAVFILVDFLSAATKRPRRHDVLEGSTSSLDAFDLAF